MRTVAVIVVTFAVGAGFGIWTDRPDAAPAPLAQTPPGRALPPCRARSAART